MNCQDKVIITKQRHMKNRLLTLFNLLFVCSGIILADRPSDYKKGWEAFANNNRTEARKLFTAALKDNSVKADAHISLSLIDWMENNKENAFAQIEEFYKIADNADPYLYSLYSLPYTFASNEVDINRRAVLLEQIAANTALSGTLRAMANSELGQYYEGTRQFEKSAAAYKAMGTINNWQVLGPFENVSGSGFNKDWGAVSKATAKDIFVNKSGAEVKWFTPGPNKTNNWFYYSYLLPSGDAIYYSQTFVDSPAEQEVYIRTGTSGSLKIWLNDVLVTSVEKEHNCDLDLYTSRVTLNKGANRILLQLGESEIAAANFMLRITDANGNPISGLTSSTDYSKYDIRKYETAPDTTPLPVAAEEFFRKKIEEQPDNMLYYVLLGETYLRSDKADEAIMTLRKAHSKAPKSSFIDLRLSEAYTRGKNPTYATKAMENIKINDPDSYTAIYSLLSEAMDNNKLPEVKRLYKKITDAYGRTNDMLGVEAWMAGNEGNMEEVIKIARELYKAYPWSNDAMSAAFSVEEYQLKNSKAATAIIEDYCSKYFDPSAIESLSERYIQDGDTEKALKVLRDRIDIMPYATGYIYSYANTMFDMQRYQEALDWTARSIKTAPYLSDTYSLRGKAYKALKENKKATEDYHEALRLYPANFDAIDQLRQLGDMKEMEDLFPKTNLDELIAKAGTQQDYPEDHSLIILSEAQQLCHPGGAIESRAELAVKILNKTGIEQWKQYNAPASGGFSLDKAEVIKANGQKVKAETNYNQVVFTDLEVGDVLHIEFRNKAYSAGLLSKCIVDRMVYRYMIPTMKVAYHLLAPKDMKFDYTTTNGDIKPRISDVEGMKMYTWALDNQKSIKQEPYMYGLSETAPMVMYSTIPDWAFVSNWYKALTNNKYQSDYLLKETMDEILKGKENASKMEKAKLFYEYILKNITYSNVPFMQNNFIPQRASRTIATRLGDCKDVSTLFVAFCRESGIDANLVLILTRDNGYNTLALPSIGFNHCIAQLRIDGKTYYLELTDNKLPFGAALEGDLEASILPIPFGNESQSNELLRLAMPQRVPNQVTRTTDVVINGTDMLLKNKSVRQGSFASYLRRQYTDLGSDERLKNMTQSVSGDYQTPIKVSNLVFGDLNSLVDTATYTFDIEAKNIIQSVAGMKIFKLVWSDNFRSFDALSLDKREFPFLLCFYKLGDKYSEQINVSLPEGKKFAEIPQDVSISCANASYSLTYDTSTAGVVKINRVFVPKTAQVSPQEYEEFKNFMHMVNEYDNKQYAIN